jgi:hypothetical protein
MQLRRNYDLSYRMQSVLETLETALENNQLANFVHAATSIAWQEGQLYGQTQQLRLEIEAFNKDREEQAQYK